MAITYTWMISDMTRNSSDGGVTNVQYACRGDDADSGEFSLYCNNVDLTYDASSPDFIAYQDLTEAQVITWVQGTVVQADIEAEVAADINSKITPPTATGVPWS